LVLLFFAIRRDYRSRESVILNSGEFRPDSSITMFIPNKEVDFGKMTRYIDSNIIFYVTAKGR